MKKGNALKCALAATAALLCTGAAVGAAFSATNNTLAATDGAEFVADRYVDATVEILINGVRDGAIITFRDTDESDNAQTRSISKIEGDKWVANPDTPTNDIDRKAEVSFIVTNTSDYSDLAVSISRTGAGANCAITDPSPASASGLGKGESATFVYRFDVDGRLDVAEFENAYSLTLEAQARA